MEPSISPLTICCENIGRSFRDRLACCLLWQLPRRFEHDVRPAPISVDVLNGLAGTSHQGADRRAERGKRFAVERPKEQVVDGADFRADTADLDPPGRRDADKDTAPVVRIGSLEHEAALRQLTS